VPSGIGSDKNAAEFFEEIVRGERLACLLDFFNKRRDDTLFFPDVYYRFKFCAFVFGGATRSFSRARFGFSLREIDDVENREKIYGLTADDIASINPNVFSSPIFRTRQDAQLNREIYNSVPVLNDHNGDALYPVRYVRMFDMANDSSNVQEC
jgi:hypothetical protein